MQTVRITTTQNIDIDYEVATLGDRFLARLVDAGVFMGVFIVFFYGYLFIFALNGRGGQVGLFIVGGVYTLALVLYDLVSEVFFNGQSIGKKAIKIRVISLSGARPGISQYLLRWVFRLVDFGITGGIAALISVAVSEKKQRIGDIVAGTTLIKTIPRTDLNNLVFSPMEDDYVPVFDEVNQLTDNDVVLIYEVISNFKKIGNSYVVFNMAERLKQHLGVTVPLGMNDFEFLEVIVKDYNCIMSRTEV